MSSEQKKSDEWLIRNAIGCWLYHFPDHPFREQYEALRTRHVYTTSSTPRRAKRRKPTTKPSVEGND